MHDTRGFASVVPGIGAVKTEHHMLAGRAEATSAFTGNAKTAAREHPRVDGLVPNCASLAGATA
jgi:hypothetical protein